MSWLAIENAIQAWAVSGSGLAADHVIWSEQAESRPTVPMIALKTLAYSRGGQDWINVEDSPLTIAATDASAASAAADTLTLAGHGWTTGDGPIQLTTTGTLPSGLSLATDYWLVVADVDTVQLATTFQLAIAAVPTVVDLADAGSGTHTITGTSETARAGVEIAHKARGPRLLSVSIQCFGADAIGAANPVAILDNVISSVVLPSTRAALNAAGVGFGSADPVQSIGSPLGSGWEPRAVTTARFFVSQETQELGTYIEIVEDPERL